MNDTLAWDISENWGSTTCLEIDTDTLYASPNARGLLCRGKIGEICMVTPKEGKRISKIDMYLNCAESFAYRSTCIKRKYGAVIVKDDVVISTGYNGSPRGFENCCDVGTCPRMERQMHQGEGYGICRAIHAEANALLNCSREQTMGADLYLTGINPGDNSIHQAKPCPICARMIIQAGINKVIMRQDDGPDQYISIPAVNLQWVLENSGI